MAMVPRDFGFSCVLHSLIRVPIVKRALLGPANVLIAAAHLAAITPWAEECGLRPCLFSVAMTDRRCRRLHRPFTSSCRRSTTSTRAWSSPDPTGFADDLPFYYLLVVCFVAVAAVSATSALDHRARARRHALERSRPRPRWRSVVRSKLAVFGSAPSSRASAARSSPPTAGERPRSSSRCSSGWCGSPSSSPGASDRSPARCWPASRYAVFPSSRASTSPERGWRSPPCSSGSGAIGLARPRGVVHQIVTGRQDRRRRRRAVAGSVRVPPPRRRSGSMTALLEAQDLSVRFGGVVALDHVDLAVRERAILGLIGPNGAGKSTCFGVLSGLLEPDEGRVLSAETTSPPGPLRHGTRLGIARTFQRVELFDHLTVREHMTLARRTRDRQVARRLPLDCSVGAVGRPTGRTTPSTRSSSAWASPVLGHLTAGSLPLGTGRLVELGRPSPPNLACSCSTSRPRDSTLDETAALRQGSPILARRPPRLDGARRTQHRAGAGPGRSG